MNMSVIKRKLMLVSLAAMLCLSSVPAFAAEPLTAESQTEPTQQASTSFTIDEAIQFAKEHSRNLAAVKASEENAKYTQKEARLTYKNVRKYSASDVQSYLVASGYAYNASRFNYRIAQRNTLMTEYTLESTVKSSFYTYINNAKKEKLAEEVLANSKERLNAAEIKYTNGFLSELEKTRFEIDVLENQNKLNAAKRASEYSMMQLKSTLNYPLDDVLTVTGEFESQPRITVTPEQAVQKAANSLTRANAEENFSLAKTKVNSYHTFYGPASASWHSASTEFALAELDYQDAINNERLNIYNTYNSLVSAYESLDLLDANINYLKNSLEAGKIMYDRGMTSADDYLDLVQQYDNTKNSRSDAELGVYLAEIQYKLTFDCPNTIFEEDDPLL